MSMSRFFLFFFLIFIVIGDAFSLSVNEGVSNSQLDSTRRTLEHAEQLLSDEMYHSGVNMLQDALTLYDGIIPGSDTNNTVIATIHYWMGYGFYHMSKYEESLSNFYQILKLEDVSPFLKVNALNGVANVYTARNNPLEARKALMQILEVEGALKDSMVILTVYNNLANTYSALHSYDTALSYLEKAYEMSFSMQVGLSRPSLMMNMANIFQVLGEWEEADYYYRKAIKECQDGNTYILNQAKYGLASLYLKTGEDDKGISLLEDVLATSRQIGEISLGILICDKLSNYYSQNGDFRKAYHYLREKEVFNDSVFNLESERNINNLKADFDIYQIEMSKLLLEKDISIYKGKIFKRNVNIAILVLAVIISFLVITVIMKRLKYRNREYKALYQQFDRLERDSNNEKEEINRNYQTELENRSKELASNSLLLIRNESVAHDIISQIQQANVDGRYREHLMKIEPYAKELLSGKGWNDFFYGFDQLNSSFFKRLDNRYPGLSSIDRRLAALLCIGLTTKEIASMTNRSVKGVETAKFRLKKKMGLSSDQSLVDELIQMKG